MAIDLDDIKRLIDLAAASGVATLDVTVSGIRVRIETAQGPAASAPLPVATAPATKAPATTPAPEPEPVSNAVRAPTDGLVHLAPSPGTPRFVAAGQSVQAGDTLCLIEVMKMFHPITASAAGTVRSIRVEDGQQVSFDEVLLELA